MSQLRAHVFAEGRVQGVFFRDSTRRRALELGLTGFVRNLEDGRVEVVFEGSEADVEEAVAWIREGPPYASVTRIEVSRAPSSGEFSGFRIRT